MTLHRKFNLLSKIARKSRTETLLTNDNIWINQVVLPNFESFRLPNWHCQQAELYRSHFLEEVDWQVATILIETFARCRKIQLCLNGYCKHTPCSSRLFHFLNRIILLWNNWAQTFPFLSKLSPINRTKLGPPPGRICWNVCLCMDMRISWKQ